MGIIIQKIVLNGELENVWGFITEPKNFSKYVYGYARGKIISHNTMGVGASYEWYGKLGPFKFKSTEKIVDWQERKYVAYAGKLFGVAFSSSMNVEEMEKNKTILTVFIQYKVPLYLGGVIVDLFLVKWIMKDYIKKSLDELNKIYAKI